MSTFHLNQAVAVADGVKIGQLFRGTLVQTVDPLDDTAFGDSFMSRIGGLEATELSGSYHYDAAVNDTPLFDRLGTSDTAVLVAPRPDEGVGATAYTFVGMHPDVTGPDGDRTGLAGGTFRIAGTSLAVRGQLLETGQTARTATFDGADATLPAVGSGETLYAQLNVVSASGTTPTLDVIVESDDADTFASATTRVTFTQATGVGAQRLTAAGPITDTFYRVSVTIGGTDPSFLFYVTVGIR